MFLYVICALLLLNAFTADAQQNLPRPIICKDISSQAACKNYAETLNLCKHPLLKELSMISCAKTCKMC
ncbi:hypothetical protein ANCCAN_03191 [Ancylostoma caninum]|uniref:ShKT domain-containing protein n=1 Tax=Ancylostoma caninum TaxID=29170 RepID=A0A368H480_ANCCA|nr:hypothetical protein ANCCAN_03191 [Ancylostoma caninum]